MLCVAATMVLLAAGAPAAQSEHDRIATATRASLSLFERWLGPAPPSSSQPVTVNPMWPAAPAAMDVESAVAFELARRWWAQPPTPLMDGASQYLQSRAVAVLFDHAFGRAGHHAQSIALFGGTYTRVFSTLVFDGPAAGLDREHLATSRVARAAHAFASLERIVGEPRLVGALRSVIERKPATDDEIVRYVNESLGQDLTWLFAAVEPSRPMNYSIASVHSEPCGPSPCNRVRVDVRHDGASSFRLLDVRADYAANGAAVTRWDGSSQARSFVFEAPSAPASIRVDPDSRNLLDDNLLDHGRVIDGTSNVPVLKWMSRWLVWLQDAMLTYSAVV
jgi:hypothetical protein